MSDNVSDVVGPKHSYDDTRTSNESRDRADTRTSLPFQPLRQNTILEDDLDHDAIDSLAVRDRSGTGVSTRINRPRRSSTVHRQQQDGIMGRVRGLSVSKILDANPAPGMWAATGAAIANAPNLTQLRDPRLAQNISFNAQGHNVHAVTVPGLIEDDAAANGEEIGLGNVASVPVNSKNAILIESVLESDRKILVGEKSLPIDTDDVATETPAHKKHTWLQTIGQGLKAFWKFFVTPSGFLITIYGLNVVGWGAMLFFLLLDAAPAMRHPCADCDDSSRKIWLEIDSQILNALFCVTGFGLAPWRFYDLYLLLCWRFTGKTGTLKKLADKNVSWFRLSYDLSEPCLTASGERAPATKRWKLDATVWLMVSNSLLQGVLSFFMWHYGRLDRPTWATGTFIALGCGVAMIAGIITWWEGRKVKKIEGPQIELREKEDSADAGV